MERSNNAQLLEFLQTLNEMIFLECLHVNMQTVDRSHWHHQTMMFTVTAWSVPALSHYFLLTNFLLHLMLPLQVHIPNTFSLVLNFCPDLALMKDFLLLFLTWVCLCFFMWHIARWVAQIRHLICEWKQKNGSGQTSETTEPRIEMRTPFSESNILSLTLPPSPRHIGSALQVVM